MKIAAGHAWNVWPDHGVTTPRRPDPEPEMVGLMERLRRLAADTHGEVCMSRVIAAVDLVEEALPAIRAEATATALAAHGGLDVERLAAAIDNVTDRHRNAFVGSHVMARYLIEEYAALATPERPADESRKP